MTGPAADARGCCRWALPGFGHDHAVGAALVVLDFSALLFGSLRAASISTQIAAVAPRAAPAGVTVQNAEGLDALPFYNQDLDTAQPPPPVARLRAQVDAADAVLLVTPANNGSVSAVLKNAIDWLSAPAKTLPCTTNPRCCQRMRGVTTVWEPWRGITW